MDIQALKKLSTEDAFAWASSFSGIPSDVLDGLWEAESGRGRNMRSPAGAEGHFQLMPKTRARFEQKLGVTVNPDDFHESLFIAAHHLRDDLKREKGNVVNALRAYNNGPAWRLQRDPRGENAAYAERVLKAAKRSPEEVNAEVALRMSAAPGKRTRSDFGTVDLEGQVRASSAEAVAEQKRKQEAELSDLVVAKWGDARVNAITWAGDLLDKPSGAQGFDYYAWEGRSDLEKQAATPDELRFLRENVNGPDAGPWALEQLKKYRDKDKLYGDYGATESFLAEAGVSLADPVGLVIGAGAGKAFGISRAALRAMAGTAPRGAVAARVVGAAAVEGAAGNIGWEAFQDATGQVKSVEDYALAAAFGAGLGAAFSPIGVRNALSELEPQMVSHVEAFRQAERERLVDLDQRARTVDPVQQARDLGDIVDAGRVGGNERRAASKVVPDELLARSVDEDPNVTPLDTDPVVQSVKATDPAPAPTEPPAAPASAQAAEPGAAEAAAALEAQRVEARVVATDTRVGEISAQMESLLQADGRRPRSGTAKRDKYDALVLARQEAREAAIQAYRAKREALPDLKGPQIDNLDPVSDGAGRTVQPLAKQSLYDALIDARSAKGVRESDVHAMNLLLRNMDPDTLKAVEVNFAPGKVRGIWRPMFKEIVVPGDQRGGAGLEGGRAAVLVHEGMHAAVQRVIADVFAGKQASPEAYAAVSRINDVYTDFRRELGERGIRASSDAGSDGAAYAASDIQEFVAQAMMDENTQRLLSEMKGRKYEDESLWDRFWKAITDMLGIGADKGTALYDVLRQLEVLVRSGGNLPDGVSLREPLGDLRSGTESPSVRSSRDSNFFRQLYEHARTWGAANPVDPGKLDTLANTYTKGAVRDTAVSDGLKMASSKNPIVRMLSGLIVEVTTGAAGRRTTADLLNHLYHHRIIGGAVNDYDHAALSWVRKNGGGWVERVTRGRVDQEFDRLVAEEIIRRRNGVTAPVDPEVTAAADAMQALYQRSLDQQKASGTLGSAWLTDDAVGYMPQALKGDAIRRLSQEQKAAVQKRLADHWAAHYKWDARFAAEFAHHYITRAMREAAGERHVDHVATNGATSVIKDTLAEMRLEMRSLDARTAAELEQVGGAPYTKRRLDIPLLEKVGGVKLLDLYETDMKKLARNHARSVAGQAALAEHNILGQRGVNNLLRAIREAEPAEVATPEEVAAVERTFSAFLGTPWHGEHRNRLAAGLAGFTRLRLMGGLAFTQLGEVANGLHMVGLSGTMESVLSLPRMFSEVRKGLKGERLANAWLGSIDRFSGYELGTEQFRMASAFDAPDDLLREYGKGDNVVERAIKSGNYAQAKVSFFRGLHAAQHRAFAERIVIQAVDYLSKSDAQSNRYLEDMGFNKEMRAALRGKLPAAVQRDAAGNAVGLDIYAFDNVELMEDFVSAVNRGTAQIIQDTFIGEKGAWAHSDLQKLALQLRTFGLTAMEKQWARNRMLAGSGIEGYAYAAGVLMAQMAFVLPIYLARLQVNAVGRDDREEYIEQGLAPAAVLQAMMNYSSAGGLAGDAFDSVASLAGGWSDTFKQDMGVKSFGTGVAGLVPGLSTVDQAMRVSRGDGSVPQALKLLPGSNLPYVQAIINATR